MLPLLSFGEPRTLAIGIHPELDPITRQSASIHTPYPRQTKKVVRRSKRRPNWKLIIPLAIILVAILSFLVIGLAKFFIWLFTPSASAFDEILPARCPLAIEGERDEVLQVLRRSVSPQQYQALGGASLASLECSRMLVAVLPAANVACDRECQAYVMDCVNSIEDLWNKNSAYPTSLSALHACPAHGRLTYTSDGQSFTLRCQSASHQTVYSSETGMAGVSLAEDNHDNFTEDNYSLEKTVAASQDAEENSLTETVTKAAPVAANTTTATEATPQTTTTDNDDCEPIDNRELAGQLAKEVQQSQSLSTASPAPLATASATPAIETAIDGHNLPKTPILPELQTSAPLVLAVADCPSTLKASLKLELPSDVQIISTDAQRAAAIIGQSQNKLTLEGSHKSQLRIMADRAGFTSLFPALSMKMPRDSRVALWKTADKHFSVRIHLPASTSQTAKSICDEPSCESVLYDLPASSFTAAGSSKLYRLLSLWPAEIEDKAAAANLPTVVGISTGEVAQPNEIYATAVRALAGRSDLEFAATFNSNSQALNWLKTSPWGQYLATSNKNPLFSANCDDELVTVKSGHEPTKCSQESLPKGIDTPHAAGWAHLTTAKGERVVSFTAGVSPDQEESRYLIWSEIEVNE